MMFHYIRIGGVKADLPEGMPEQMWEYIEGLEQRLQPDFVDLIEGNEIFISRTRGIGKITPEKAVEMGLTGVPLRCTGVPFDVRKHYPYGWYKNLDFDVITDEAGDVEASYRVRIGEVKQSIRMIKQILEDLPKGEVMADLGRRIRPDEGDGIARVESRAWRVRSPRRLRRLGHALPGPLPDPLHGQHAALAGDRAGPLPA
jgi:NADH-quinone oxidoreductase subunit D